MQHSLHSQQALERRFGETCWSLVAAAAPGSANPRQALSELCLRYWYPVYAYVRQCGHAAATANDIAQAFFEQLQDDADSLAGARREGRFRHYLLRRLNLFLAEDWQQLHRAERSVATPGEDFEARHRHDNAPGDAPEQAFERSFALEVLTRGFRLLRREAEDTGHLGMFEALEPYLGNDPQPGELEQVARTLGTRPLTLSVALRRLRQRFRELIDRELADTVRDSQELVAEQAALQQALRRD